MGLCRVEGSGIVGVCAAIFLSASFLAVILFLKLH